MPSYGKVTISGTSVGTEVWSTSFALASTTALGTWDQTLGDAQAAAALAVTIPTNLLALLSSSLHMTTIRWEQRDVATNALQGVSLATSSPGVLGTGTASKTAQDSVVFSLRTTTPGASGRGRMYWPAVGAGISNSTLRMSAPGPSVVAPDAVTYIKAIATAIRTTSGSFLVDLFPVVYSQKLHQTLRITRLQVGDIIDTQRRRRDSLPEIYSSVAV